MGLWLGLEASALGAAGLPVTLILTLRSALGAAGLADDGVHRLLWDASPEGRAAAIAGEGPNAVMAGAGLNAVRGTQGAGEPDP